MTTEQKFNCIFCKDVFDNKEELQVHFRKHADPSFKSTNRFLSDAQASTEKVKENADTVSCDVCSQMFPTISKAITHKHKVHPDHDAKYFCPWCGKLFTMKHPYNIHIQSSHENQEQIDSKIFHCDSCDVDFFLATAMLYHNKFFHRQDSDIPDIGTSKKMRLYNQEAILLYYCAFCGEEYENKVNLYKHMADDHGDENQCPEEVLRCPLCEAIFYHLDAYEIHLSFHSTEDLYSVQNELFAQVLDFSLETVPPMVEKVETKDDEIEGHQSQDTDAEASMNTLGIESFLELAMGQADDSNSEKVKKKKHKKSKKAAITLDEFLSMNQDVFGEGLDFHGVEEVPTQAVAKRFNKNNKKATKAAAAAELEKLKQKGIVVMKVGAKKPPKNLLKKLPIRPTIQAPNKGIKSSNDVISKLVNQSNNQLKIVKKSVPSMAKQNTEDIQNKIMDNDNHGQMPNEDETVGLEDKEPMYNKNNEDPEIPNLKPDDSQFGDVTKSPSTEIKQNLITPAANVNSPKDIVNKNTTNGEVDESSTKGDIDKQLNNTISNDQVEQSYKVTTPGISPPPLGQDKNDIESNNSKNDGIDEAQSNHKESDEAQSDHKESDSEMHDKSYTSDTENMDVDLSDKPQIRTFNSSSENSSPQHKSNKTVSSLSTLKYLSHLTVKPVSQNKNTLSELTVDKVSDISTESVPQDKCNKEKNQPSITTDKDNGTCPTKPKVAVDKDPTLDALKILGKNITIKSLTSTPATRNNEETHSDDDDEASAQLENQNESTTLKDVTGNKNITITKIKELAPGNKVVNMLDSPIKNSQASKTVNKILTLASESKPNKPFIGASRNNNIKSNTDILKRLTNITTKPVFSQKNVRPNIVKLANTSIKTIKNKPDEIIEISDIDDSDNEIDTSKEQEIIKTDPLKSLSKHITIKSVNQPAQPILKVNKIESAEEHTDDDDFGDAFHSDDDDDELPANMKMCSQKLSNKNVAFKNALKNVSKNVSIKSGPSPCPQTPEQFQNHDSQHSDVDKDAESDPDEDTGKLKITEIEEYHDDNDDNFENMDDFDAENDNNPIVESPHDSDNEESDKDFESEIQSNTVQKTHENIINNKNTICLNNLKNISKNLTIKSLNTNSTQNQDRFKAPTQESTDLPKTQNKQPSTKQSKPLAKETLKESSSNAKPLKNMGKVNHCASNESMNQNVSVNKEVTVKTFQTKTVIQEITTTVTKTIKTVNQTMKQETKNSSQMNIPVLPQKVQGMRPNLSKNLQGVVIRQSPPAVVNPSNAMVPFRPSVRPSKQIIPFRPGLNTSRPATPRMPSVKPNLPKSSPKQHVIGKPLKFSPSAITTSTVKRSSVEEATGPFSCFKKAKESLIPGADMSTLAGGGESMVQMQAASHTSTSNFTTTSKMVKGNKVVTATQMKSEVTSMQQLSKLNSLGIQVKSSHVNQTQVNQTQVQGKSEPSGMKRTTLDAIEKLQKQGLLIKKPRVEYSDSDHGEDNVDEDNLGYSSAEEHDE